MTKAEAGQVVAYLNAVFHREALEPATVAVWVDELVRLKSYDVGMATAKALGRTMDRFPTLHQYREDYLRRRGREVDHVNAIESLTSGPRELPPAALELFERLGIRPPKLRDMPDA